MVDLADARSLARRSGSKRLQELDQITFIGITEAGLADRADVARLTRRRKSRSSSRRCAAFSRPKLPGAAKP
jgi:hypothetical protein